MKRRKFVLATVLTATGAGCLGDGDSPEATPEDTPMPTTEDTPTPEPTPTPTPEPTETTTPEPTDTPTPEPTTTATPTPTPEPSHNELGEPYEAADGLTVTLESFEITEATGSFRYAIDYTLANNTDEAIDEGAFKLYGDEGLPQYGAFDRVFPGEEISRSHIFEEEKDVTFRVLAYHHDQFFAESPPDGAVTWAVEY